MLRNSFGRAEAFVRAFAIILTVLVLGSSPMLAGKSPGVVNVNTATVEQLMRLPGVGQTRAQAIVALRKKQGAFRKVEDLRAVRGIGEASLEKLRPLVVFEGRTTLPPE